MAKNLPELVQKELKKEADKHETKIRSQTRARARFDKCNKFMEHFSARLVRLCFLGNALLILSQWRVLGWSGFLIFSVIFR